MTPTEENLESDPPQQVSSHENIDASKQISQTDCSKGFIPSAAALFFIDNLGRNFTLVCKTLGSLLTGLCLQIVKVLPKLFLPSSSSLFFLENLGRNCMLVCKTLFVIDRFVRSVR